MAKDCKPNVALNNPSAGTGAAAATADAAQLEKLCEVVDLLENPVPIESSFAAVGCIVDPQTGEVSGKVLACISVDDEGVKQVELVAISPGEPIVRNYTGPWEPCEGVEYTVTTAEVCWRSNSTTFQTLTAHYIYGPTIDETMPSRTIIYTDGRNGIVDPVAGSVAVGPCPVDFWDLSWEKLCDLQPNGTVVEFYSRSGTRIVGGVGVPADGPTQSYFNLERTQPYTVTGTIVSCESCQPQTARGLLNSWG